MATALQKLRYYHILGAAMGICAIASFMAMDLCKDTKAGILVAWLVSPPIYLFFELHWVRRLYPTELENCKLSQESASRIWAGVAAALAVVFFKLD